MKLRSSVAVKHTFVVPSNSHFLDPPNGISNTSITTPSGATTSGASTTKNHPFHGNKKHMKNSRNVLRIPSISSKSNRLKALAASTTPSALKLSTQFNQMKAPSPSSKRKLQRISNALGSFHDRSMTVTPPSCLLSMIMDGLYLSSADVAMNKEMMKSNDITHILNVSSGIGRVFPNDFTYLCREIADLPTAPLLDYFEEFNEFIDQARRCSGVVLVHCNQGISRSAAVVIAYLIYALSIPYEHAYCMVECVRPSIRPNNGFIYQLKKFQELSARHRLT